MAEIERLYAEGFEYCGLFCKGHVSFEEFQAGITEFNKWEEEDNEIKPEQIQRVLVRCIPYGSDHPREHEDGLTYFQRCKEAGRGVFPITYVDYMDRIAL